MTCGAITEQHERFVATYLQISSVRANWPEHKVHRHFSRRKLRIFYSSLECPKVREYALQPPLSISSTRQQLVRERRQVFVRLRVANRTRITNDFDVISWPAFQLLH